MAELSRPTFQLPAGHPVFAGHFPGLPLVPGVMLLEWVLREAAASLQLEPHDLRIRESKFFSPMRPDEEAVLLLERADKLHPFRVLRGEKVLVSGVLESR